MQRSLYASTLVGAALTACAASASAQSIAIQQPWARETSASAPNGAVYMSITNSGERADRLTGATGDIAQRIELHSHTMDEEGVMRMRHVDVIEVPAGGATALAPGGLHIMLMGLDEPLEEGTSFPLTLSFEGAGDLPVEVTVTDITGPSMEHGEDGATDGMGDGSMEHGENGMHGDHANE